MKLTYQMRRWMNICLIIVMLISGMCFESVKIHSYSGASRTDSASTLQIVHKSVITPELCGWEQLGEASLRGVQEVFHRNTYRQKSRSLFKLCTLVSCRKSHATTAMLAVFLVAILFSFIILHYETIIISYIHHQDGSKG